jgi:hypothetical protein
MEKEERRNGAGMKSPRREEGRKEGGEGGREGGREGGT